MEEVCLSLMKSENCIINGIKPSFLLQKKMPEIINSKKLKSVKSLMRDSVELVRTNKIGIIEERVLLREKLVY